MHKVIALALFLPILQNLTAQSKQESVEEEPPSTFLVTLNQDNVFGFVPNVNGSFPRKKKKWDITFYGNFWTNPAFADSDGSDSWVEAGLGLGRRYGGGKWFINPSIGLTHGKLLSGAKAGIYADGVVPSLTLTLKGRRVESDVWLGYYKAFRNGGKRAISTDYFLGWAYSGMIISKNISLGMHVENFRIIRVTKGEPENLYSWFGAYLKFKVKENYWMRFATGWNLDLKETYGQEYYRLTAGISFL